MRSKRNGTTSAPEDLTVTLEYFLNSSDSFTLVFVFISLVTAYVIFGIAGFGAALIAAPVLAHRIPVANRLLKCKIRQTTQTDCKNGFELFPSFDQPVMMISTMIDYFVRVQFR
jgi:hypothetical protein